MMKKLLATMGAGLILAVLASCEAPTEPKAYNQGINIITCKSRTKRRCL